MSDNGFFDEIEPANKFDPLDKQNPKPANKLDSHLSEDAKVKSGILSNKADPTLKDLHGGTESEKLNTAGDNLSGLKSQNRVTFDPSIKKGEADDHVKPEDGKSVGMKSEAKLIHPNPPKTFRTEEEYKEYYGKLDEPTKKRYDDMSARNNTMRKELGMFVSAIEEIVKKEK